MPAKVFRLGRVICAFTACAFFVWGAGPTVAVPPLEVVRFNDGSRPVAPSTGIPDNFQGYFSPRAGESFETRINGEWTEITISADGGCRFGDSRGEGQPAHTGIDLCGWVERVTTDGRPPGYLIHLFDSTWQVHNKRAGLIDDKTTDSVDIEHYAPDETEEEYRHLSNLISKVEGDEVAVNEVLGTIQDLPSPQMDHLHYALRDENSNYINPESTDAGTRGLTRIVIPEPTTLSLLAVGGVVIRRRRRLT